MSGLGELSKFRNRRDTRGSIFKKAKNKIKNALSRASRDRSWKYTVTPLQNAADQTTANTSNGRRSSTYRSRLSEKDTRRRQDLKKKLQEQMKESAKLSDQVEELNNKIKQKFEPLPGQKLRTLMTRSKRASIYVVSTKDDQSSASAPHLNIKDTIDELRSTNFQEWDEDQKLEKEKELFSNIDFYSRNKFIFEISVFDHLLPTIDNVKMANDFLIRYKKKLNDFDTKTTEGRRKQFLMRHLIFRHIQNYKQMFDKLFEVQDMSLFYGLVPSYIYNSETGATPEHTGYLVGIPSVQNRTSTFSPVFPAPIGKTSPFTVGKGSYGKVKIALSNQTGQERAQKKIKIVDVNDFLQLWREYTIAQLLQSSSNNTIPVDSLSLYVSIRKQRQGLEQNRNAFLMMPLLEDFFQGASPLSHNLKFNERRQLSGELCLTLKQIHKQGVTVNDLKPGNLLSRATHTRDKAIIITDFGLAATKQQLEDKVHPVLNKNTAGGTLRHKDFYEDWNTATPEKKLELLQKNDVFALALCLSTTLFSDINEMDLYTISKNSNRFVITKEILIKLNRIKDRSEDVTEKEICEVLINIISVGDYFKDRDANALLNDLLSKIMKGLPEDFTSTRDHNGIKRYPQASDIDVFLQPVTHRSIYQRRLPLPPILTPIQRRTNLTNSYSVPPRTLSASRIISILQGNPQNIESQFEESIKNLNPNDREILKGFLEHFFSPESLAEKTTAKQFLYLLIKNSQFLDGFIIPLEDDSKKASESMGVYKINIKPPLFIKLKKDPNHQQAGHIHRNPKALENLTAKEEYMEQNKVYKVYKVYQDDNWCTPKPICFFKNMLVMNFIEGKTLYDSLCDEDDVSKITTAQFLVLKKALDQSEIIHGDLTDHNIILRDERLFIIDFGTDSKATQLKKLFSEHLRSPRAQLFFPRFAIFQEEPENNEWENPSIFNHYALALNFIQLKIQEEASVILGNSEYIDEKALVTDESTWKDRKQMEEYLKGLDKEQEIFKDVKKICPTFLNYFKEPIIIEDL